MPDIFLSYSRDDTLSMRVIRDNLRALGFNIWVDIEHLKPGTPQWEADVKRAVGKTDGMLVLCSPSAEKSIWIGREIHMAQLAGKPVAPVLIAGDEWDAIPAGLMGAQYCDMRGRSGPEKGFRELVTWLAERFEFPVPEYELSASGSIEIPAVQVINIQGHVEGHVIAIGRDVGGDVQVAGGDIQQQEIAPPEPEPAQPIPDAFRESRPAPAPAAPRTPSEKKAIPTRVIGIGAAGVVLVALIIAAIATRGFGLFEGTTSDRRENDTATQAASESEQPADEPADEPAAEPEPEPTDEPEPEPGFESVTRNADWSPIIETINGVEMALVPAGCFELGSEDGSTDERPTREVCFEEPFWIDVYEVTNDQYGYGECGDDSFDGPNQPHACVTWADARAYCQSRGARLPTEAEWEYAASGPDNLTYPWGNEFYEGYVVYNIYQSEDVGSMPRGVSWVGAYDMSGNVWEWVNDWYDQYTYRDMADGAVNPQGPAYSTEIRVIRGGSWGEYDDMTWFTTSVRYSLEPEAIDVFFGFRCAMSY